MSATTSRRNTPRGSAPLPGPRRSPRARRPPVPVRRRIDPVLLWRSGAEGAAAALCAVIAMAAMSALALALLGAGSVGPFSSLTLAVTAAALGGSLRADGTMATGAGSSASGTSALFGGGGTGPTMSGVIDIVPLGVTLVGTVVLWFAFSRRLRQLETPELTVRIFGTAVTALISLSVVAGLAHGSVTVPKSAMSRLGASQTAGSSGGGNQMSSMFGGSGTTAQTMAFHVDAGLTVLGTALGLLIMLTACCLVSLRLRVPFGGGVGRQRSRRGPGISTVFRALVVLGTALPLLVALVGIIVGGRVETATGAALLIAPNALLVLLTLGLGAQWTAGTHPVASQGQNPFAGMMGSSSGGAGTTSSSGQRARTEHLGSLPGGGGHLQLAALAVAVVVLLLCAYASARAIRRLPPMRTQQAERSPLVRHLGVAARFAVATSAILGMSTWLAGGAGSVAMSMMGSEMGGMQADLSGDVPRALAWGLLAGVLAGLAGSLLSSSREAKIASPALEATSVGI